MPDPVVDPAAMSAVRAMFEAAAAKPRKVEKVPVPGLGDVFVRALTVEEYDEYELDCAVKVGDELRRKGNRANLVRRSVVTADGCPVFRDDHLEMLRGLSIAIINPIANAAMALCGMAGEAKKIEGNSEAPHDDA